MTELRIALAGNPNSGKTTMFNVLTGSNQYVGNWPGVTVEKKEGKLRGREGVTVTDLPGIYSLSPYTPEEIVARNYLVGERPDAILNIVDGTNLERNLYLTTQLCELGIPVVIAINMMDVLRRNNDKINIETLGEHLGCKIVEISALRGDGVLEAADAAIEAAKEKKAPPVFHLSGRVEHALAHIEEATVHEMTEPRQRWYSIKLFERDEKVLSELALSEDKLEHIENDIKKVERMLDDDAESIIANERYVFIDELIRSCYKRKKVHHATLSDKIDLVVTNRFAALPIFAVIMLAVYAISIGTVGEFATGFMNDGLFGSFAENYAGTFMESWKSVPELLDMVLLDAAGEPTIYPWLYSLIQDGIVGGVGAVLGFVPQMLILFLLLSLLEDCGYMSRVAFIMDRLFRKFGLSGKSFIPLLVASGCGVPGVMATRTIESERDRRMTIMTTCFIPCGAKMPIVALIAGAMFRDSWLGGAWVATTAYFVGVAAVILSGIMLKKTKPFSGEPAPFVMELPAYHMPRPSNVLRTTGDRGLDFVKRAGTVIFAASIIIWTLNSLSFEGGFHYITDDVGGASVLENIGNVIAWIFVPLGFGQWQSAVATILGLVAKEEVVGVFGALGLGSAETAIGTVLGGDGLAGFSFLMFNLLCAPCFAAMGAIRREMNNGKWTAFALTYMCAFAYAVSLCVYQIGTFITSAMAGSLDVWNYVGLGAALVIIAGFLYMLLRKNKNEMRIK